MTGPKQRIIVDGVDFGSIFRFGRILRSITAAMQPPRLVVALLMVVTIVAVGRAWDGMAEPRVHPAGLLAGSWGEDDAARAEAEIRAVLALAGAPLEVDEPVPGAAAAISTLDERYRVLRPQGRDDAAYLAARARLDAVRLRGPYDASASLVIDRFRRVVRGLVTLRPQLVYSAVADLCVRFPRALWNQDPVFGSVFGLLVLIVVAIGGGALCRMAACDFAGQERLRIRDAFDFALGNWVKLVLTPLLPLLIAGGLAVVLIAMGLLLAPWANVVGGPLYAINILLGFLLTFVLLGYAVGFPLLLPAVACENCDAGDAQQRAYGYVLSRPLLMLGYVVVLLAGLALGFAVVSVVASMSLGFAATLSGVAFDSSALLGAGGFDLFDSGPPGAGAMHGTWHEGWAAATIGFWVDVVLDLVAAWVLAYLFTATTIVYLLMRHASDGQDIEEIWRPGYIPGTLVPTPREQFTPMTTSASTNPDPDRDG